MRHLSPRLATSLLAVSLVSVSMLAGCNTREALNPAAIQPVEPPVTLAAPNPLAPPSPGAPPPSGATTPPAVAAIPAVRLQFAPVVGATVDAATPLSRRLTARAAERGLAMAGGATPATHVVKGYFSALGEGGETIVIFVWDVLGPTGNRLHRIQGQERVGATAPDAWAAVPPQTMETIADRTMEELARWLAAGPT